MGSSNVILIELMYSILYPLKTINPVILNNLGRGLSSFLPLCSTFALLDLKRAIRFGVVTGDCNPRIVIPCVLGSNVSRVKRRTKENPGFVNSQIYGIDID